MSILNPSHQHERERAARERGERIENSSVAKRQLDEAVRAWNDAKAMTAAEARAQGAPERITQARDAIAAARSPRELDRAFRDAVRLTRR